MLPSSADNTDRRGLRRWAPVLGIVAVIAAIAAVVALSGDGDQEQRAADEPTGERPAGAISISEARARDLDVTFPETCDLDRETIAIPDFYAPECYAQLAGDNGGATSTGVTADTIKVVVYQAPEDDPIIGFITSAIPYDDTNEQAAETYRGYVDLYNRFAQTYGRKVELEFVTGSGVAIDEGAARADAARVAEEIKPFAVWGGPALTGGWTDELNARGIVCLSCPGGPDATDERTRSAYSITAAGYQARTHLAEHISKQVAGRPAEHAGDPSLRSRERVFGHVFIETGESSREGADDLARRLDAEGVELAVQIPYTLDPGRLGEQARTIIARLKDAGVTTVIFQGDPVAPATFTQEATSQEWFPEWYVGAATLVDTTAFARTYDQRQWANAFGVSMLAARTDPRQSSSWRLHEWFTGSPPPADETAALIWPQPALFFAALQAAGPNLTPATFRDGLFSLDPTPDAITNPSVSYGDHDLWPRTDWNGIDDATEIWWDPEATGEDEIRREGTGMWQYTDGGARYLPGAWPDRPTRAFVSNGAVAIYERPPPGERPPDYPSPAGEG